jgi:tetratricopeptide (TPR) repeat protein
MLPLVLAVAIGCGAPGPDAGAVPAEERAPLYDDLGSHSHAISTAVPAAQRYFDQGLRLTYAFNHAEAIRSFTEATRLDPDCAMCFWGIALAWGPNINAPMDSAGGAAAWAAVREAVRLAPGASPEERALIGALATRYAESPPAERAALDSAWARAMAEVAAQHPDDDDALALYADALMNLSPWDYWQADGQPKPATIPMLASLETVIARNENHAGACHLYIHAVEKVQPERGVGCAERLPSLMPGAGHIVHMPAHIFVRVGRYADAITANEHATHADESRLDEYAPEGLYRLAYYPHNYHFMWFAASMAGNVEIAMSAARQTAAKVNPALMREPDYAALQHYLVTPLFTMVRFGRWDEILAEPAPPADVPYAVGILRYARALAHIAGSRLAEAEAELAALDSIRAATPELADLLIWAINPAAANLDIAAAVVAGELAAARGRFDAAVASLRRGVAIEDAMLYDEPPTWHLPVRQNLGAVLLAAGRAVEAESVYRADLERFPENGWSLHGLATSLDAQGKRAEANAARARFSAAWSRADVQPAGSRF